MMGRQINLHHYLLYQATAPSGVEHRCGMARLCIVCFQKSLSGSCSHKIKTLLPVRSWVQLLAVAATFQRRWHAQTSVHLGMVILCVVCVRSICIVDRLYLQPVTALLHEHCYRHFLSGTSGHFSCCSCDGKAWLWQQGSFVTDHQKEKKKNSVRCNLHMQVLYQCAWWEVPSFLVECIYRPPSCVKVCSHCCGYFGYGFNFNVERLLVGFVLQVTPW